MSNRAIFNFDNENNYNFDSTKIEFVGGVAKLKAIVVGTGAELYAKLDENQGLVAADSSGNARHGAFQGGYDENQWDASGKIGSCLQGLSLSSGFVNFNQLLSFDRANPFSLECWLKTTSSNSMTLLSKQSNVGNFPGIAITMSSAKPRLVIRDTTSGVLVLEHNSAINDGLWHHIVITYDGTSQISGCKLYVDNFQNNTVISAVALTSTIVTTADFQISGRDGNNNTIDASTFIDECLVYSRALSPAEINVRWNSGNGTQTVPGAGTSYPIDNPTISTKGTIRVTDLVSAGSTIVTSGNDVVKWVVVVNGTNKYWDGATWSISSGYAQSNTIVEVNSNISSLGLVGIEEIFLKRFLHSDDGTTTPEIINDYFDYNYNPTFATLQIATVYGSIYDLDGSTTTTTINVQTVKKIIGTSTIITSDLIPVTYNTSTGNFQVDLFYEDIEPNELKWHFDDNIIITEFKNGINNYNTLTIK